MSQLKKLEDESASAQIPLEGQVPPGTAEKETEENSHASNRSQETCLMIEGDENNPQKTRKKRFNNS